MKNKIVLVSVFLFGAALATVTVALLLQGEGEETMDSDNQAQGSVVVNGLALSKRQLSEFAAKYRAQPAPGSYWYDKRSGLWGYAGMPAAGFLLPDHDLGTLAEGAAGGNTQVFLNGRHLPYQEVVIFSRLIGQIIVPGRYWLDGTGNYGYEGMQLAIGNLYLLAVARGGGGGGGGGDNFWSTRFSAGNSNADNTQGYVNVPGVGPVGYGF